MRRALGALDSAAFMGGGARTWTASGGSTFAEDLAVLPVGNRVDSSVPLFVVADDSTGRQAGDEAAIPVPPLLQLRRTYLLYEHEDGVVLIDQHSAHERVLYEKFMREMMDGGATSQRLLMPETLHLSPQDAESLESHRAALAGLGFELEPFGGHSVIVHAVPAPHRRFDALRCLRETLAALTGDRGGTSHAGHELLVATVACKAAVKAGEPLAPDEARALYRALLSTTLPAHDVHGRSGIVRLTWDELDRRFGRR